MQLEAYFRIVSDEDSIRSFYSKAGLPDSTIGPLKARKDGGKGVWWSWQTRRIRIDNENPDNGLKEFLAAHSPIFPAVKKLSGTQADVYLEIVSHYDEGEEPQGFYLSADTIHLLSDIGCSLDNDVVIGVPIAPF